MLIHFFSSFFYFSIFIKVVYISGKPFCCGDCFVEIPFRFDMPFLLCISLLTNKNIFFLLRVQLSHCSLKTISMLYIFSVLSICLLIFEVETENDKFLKIQSNNSFLLTRGYSLCTIISKTCYIISTNLFYVLLYFSHF